MNIDICFIYIFLNLSNTKNFEIFTPELFNCKEIFISKKYNIAFFPPIVLNFKSKKNC